MKKCLVAALVLMFMISIMNMLVDVRFAVVHVGMLMFIIVVATHLDSPPINIFQRKFYYISFSFTEFLRSSHVSRNRICNM